MDDSDTHALAGAATMKTMPLASVIYVVTFDAEGRATLQASIHADTAGRLQFTGDAMKAYIPLQAAHERCLGRLAESITLDVVKRAEERRLLADVLENDHALVGAATSEPEPLPATGDNF